MSSKTARWLKINDIFVLPSSEKRTLLTVLFWVTDVYVSRARIIATWKLLKDVAEDPLVWNVEASGWKSFLNTHLHHLLLYRPSSSLSFSAVPGPAAAKSNQALSQMFVTGLAWVSRVIRIWRERGKFWTNLNYTIESITHIICCNSCTFLWGKRENQWADIVA